MEFGGNEKREAPPHRAEYKKHSGVGVVRKRLVASLRRENRESLVASKRQRMREFGEEDLDRDPIHPELLSTCVAALQMQGNSTEQAKALAQLKEWLSAPDPDIEGIVSAGAVEPLSHLIQCGHPSAHFQAAWCICNIASSGMLEHSMAVMGCVPALLAHCESDDKELVKQCVWAISNIATMYEETANGVVQCGALAVLAGIVRKYARTELNLSTCSVCPLEVVGDRDDESYHPPEDRQMTLADYQAPNAKTLDGEIIVNALCALSNIARFRAHHPMMMSHGLGDMLPRLLLHEEQGVAVEAAWVMAYLTAPGERLIDQLFGMETISALDGNGRRIPLDGPNAMSPSLAAFVLIGMCYDPNNPNLVMVALRSLGNVVNAGSNYVEELLKDCRFLLYLRKLLTKSLFRAVRKEAAYVVSNIAVSHPQALVDSGILKVMINLLFSCSFVVKRELCYGLVNIAHDTGNMSQIVDAGVLPIFVNMLKTSDLEAHRFSLDFIELVLQHHPHGVKLVESLDGIDAMERLQLNGNERLYARVSHILDKYFSEVPPGDLTHDEPREYPPWRRG